MKTWDLIVVGGGIAGISAARAFLSVKADASVMLVDAEDALPYKRTRLSKVRFQPTAMDAYPLADDEFFQRVEAHLGFSVVAVNTDARTIHLDDGTSWNYQNLLIATGARAVLPPELRTPGGLVRPLRQRSDLEALAGPFAQARSVLVVGGGILGVEMAVQAAEEGKLTVLLARGETLLARDFDPVFGVEIEARLKSLGVEVVLGDAVRRVGDHDKNRAKVELSTGVYAFDLIMAALGSEPETRVAQLAGCLTDRGIRVDQEFRTSVEGIRAAGDCAQGPDDKVCHLWHQAETQGWHAGLAMAGEMGTYPLRPWRLKFSLGDTYWWSCRPEQRREPVYYELAGGRVLAYIADGLIQGLEFQGPQAWCAVAEEAVINRWPVGEFMDKII